MPVYHAAHSCNVQCVASVPTIQAIEVTSQQELRLAVHIPGLFKWHSVVSIQWMHTTYSQIHIVHCNCPFGSFRTIQNLNVYVIPSLVTNRMYPYASRIFMLQQSLSAPFSLIWRLGVGSCLPCTSPNSQRKCLIHEYDYRSACSVLRLPTGVVPSAHLAHKPDISGACALQPSVLQGVKCVKSE